MVKLIENVKVLEDVLKQKNFPDKFHVKAVILDDIDSALPILQNLSNIVSGIGSKVCFIWVLSRPDKTWLDFIKTISNNLETISLKN